MTMKTETGDANPVPRWLIFGLAVLIVAVCACAAAGISFPHSGPIGAIEHALVSAAVCGTLAACLWIIQAIREPLRSRKWTIRLWSATFLMCAFLTYFGSRAYPAEKLFTSVAGIEVPATVRDLQGFVAQPDIQDPIFGFRFVTDPQTVRSIANAMELFEEGRIDSKSWSPPFAQPNYPTPHWFTPAELNRPLRWSREVELREWIELYFDEATGIAYLCVTYL
jgi:hypothetical protein